jgi:hypothetical protein
MRPIGYKGRRAKEENMALLDHFHAPLYPQRAWESFHSRWANCIADKLHAVLPGRYYAEVQIRLGNQVEADVVEFEGTAAMEEGGNGAPGSLAVQPWAPPIAAFAVPAVFPDDLEVQVRDERDDARLVAVVELVSPRNKDRPESRRGFAAKCAAYLQRGIGVMVLDIVTNRQANLHNELLLLLDPSSTRTQPAEVSLYAVSYGPIRRQDADQIAVWPVALTVGGELPLLPLVIRGYQPVPLDLEAAYTDARQRSRL